MAQVTFLVDTNILLRLLQPKDADYALVRAAVEHLRSLGASGGGWQPRQFASPLRNPRRCA